jgi:hypothetical protein
MADTDDTGRSDLPSSAWAGADAAAALTKAYELADAHAASAADWYTNAMKWRGRSARTIRLVALVFFGLGSVIPIAKSFLQKLPLTFEWNDVGYVSLAIGAGLLGFDYFFGISSAYTRFVTTGIALRNARLRFQTDWLVLLSESGGLKADALKPFVDRLKEFVATTLQLVDRETQEWVAEFRSSLAELEKLGNRAPHAATAEPRPDEAVPAAAPKNGGPIGRGAQPPAPIVKTPGPSGGGGADEQRQ